MRRMTRRLLLWLADWACPPDADPPLELVTVEPPPCDRCGKPAAWVYTWHSREQDYLCQRHYQAVPRYDWFRIPVHHQETAHVPPTD